jgi:hypothetical protein
MPHETVMNDETPCNFRPDICHGQLLYVAMSEIWWLHWGESKSKKQPIKMK